MYLEKLHTNTSKHELEEGGDDEDVANRADGHEHTLNHTLKTSGQHSFKVKKLT